MWFWNRQELYMGNSLEKYARIKQVLAQNNIRYDMRVMNQSGSGPFGWERSRTGTLGINLEVATYYYVYVHKNDYDRAVYLIDKKD